MERWGDSGLVHTGCGIQITSVSKSVLVFLYTKKFVVKKCLLNLIC